MQIRVLEKRNLKNEFFNNTKKVIDEFVAVRFEA